MKLNEMYMNKGYYDAMILQYKDELQSQGFKVKLGKSIPFEGNPFCADLYASKKGEKRLYEFKLIGNGKIPNIRQRESIKRFNEIASAIDAKPFVIYVNPPEKIDIKIEGLENGLYAYMVKQAKEDLLPPTLKKISPKAEIVSVHVEKKNNVNISSQYVKVDGEATINVKFPYVHETYRSQAFPMNFKAVFIVNNNELLFKEIEEYSIDTSNW